MLDIKDDINMIIVTSLIKYVQASLQNAKYVRVTFGMRVETQSECAVEKTEWTMEMPLSLSTSVSCSV